MSDLINNNEPGILPAGHFNPVLYIKDNFKCKAFERDYDLEQHEILRARVELFLLTTLTGDRIKEWLAGKRTGDFYIINDGELSLNLQSIADSPQLLFRTVYDPILNPRVIPQIFSANSKHAEFIGARHFSIRLFSLANQVERWSEIPFDGSELEESDIKIDEDPAVVLERKDKQSTYHLAYHFGISEEITAEPDISESSWRQSIVNHTFKKESDEKFIPFLVKGNVLAYSVMIKKIRYKTMLLPINFYVRTADPTEILLTIMPRGKYPLYNTSMIYKNSDAVIFLTDILELVLFNRSSSNVIFSSFYGGIKAVEKTDCSPIYSREVYWLLLDKCPAADPKDKYRVALKVYAQLLEHGVNFTVVKFKNHSWNIPAKLADDTVEGNFEDISLLSVKEFLKEAESNGVHIPDALRENDYGLIPGGELEKRKYQPFIVNYILRKRFLMLLYAYTGIGKSWVGLSIAIALIHKKSVFIGKWDTDGENHKVFYASGEMDDGEIGERVKLLHETYAGPDINKDNFILKLGTYHNLVAPEDQEEFEKAIHRATMHEGTPGLKVSLVVLDNLSTLTTNGELPGNWDKLFRWICKLKEKGITVIVIHHEGKKGDIRGTSKISDKADMKIHALQASTNDNVSLFFKCEKPRSVPKSFVASFKAEIDLKAPSTGWVTSEMTDEEYAELNAKIKEGSKPKTKKVKKIAKGKPWKPMTNEEKEKTIRDDHALGLSNSSMALKHDISLPTIEKFRKEHSLRDIDLKNKPQPTV
ncbi:MAG: AAA family ATPase [Lentisphaerota bacterium]